MSDEEQPGKSPDPRYPDMRVTVSVPEGRPGWSYSDFIDDDTMPTLISRDDVLEHLSRENAEISERTLRSWEASGMLPRPIRRWGKAGARSSARALYPNWAVTVVAIARMIRGAGVSPNQTRGELQRYIPQIVASHNQGVRYGIVSYHLGRVIDDISGCTRGQKTSRQRSWRSESGDRTATSYTSKSSRCQAATPLLTKMTKNRESASDDAILVEAAHLATNGRIPRRQATEPAKE